MRTIFVLSLLVLAFFGCSSELPSAGTRGQVEPAAAPGVVIRAGVGGSSSSSGAGGDGPGYDCPPDPADVCNYTCVGWPAPHPDGCVCGLECPAPSGPCMDVACSGAVLPFQGGACSEHYRAPGLWCMTTGVGTCDALGHCLLPTGMCDPIPATPVSCSFNDADCEDGNPCTKKVCTATLCTNQPLPDGMPCGVGKTCNAGACCEISAVDGGDQ